MPYRRIIFEENRPIHIISRAVDKQNIFEKEEDCYRFIFQIFAANIGRPGLNLWRKDIVRIAKTLLRGEDVSSKLIIKEHSPLVYVLDFSLVWNHFHLYLMPNIKEGNEVISLFMQKLNGGFAKYFNLKYGRKGALFGSRYQSIPAKTDFQNIATERYVSIINPLDIHQPGWREDGLKEPEEAFEFLKNYQFSSFPDKIKIRKSKIIAPLEILEKNCLSWKFSEDEYSQYVKSFLEEKSNNV